MEASQNLKLKQDQKPESLSAEGELSIEPMMRKSLIFLLLLGFCDAGFALGLAGSPRIPAGGAGLRGSAGIGFTEFTVHSPSTDFKLDRGTYIMVSLERGFDFANLYFTMSLGHMNADGHANYSYTNLSSSQTYTASDVAFKAAMTELALGFKFRLIDKYWFSPYIEGGGVGCYNDVKYTANIEALTAQGSDWKRNEVIMGSGYYGEGGIDVKFSEKFGLKFAGRMSEVRSKNMETLSNRPISLKTETYYLSATFGF